MSFPLEHWNRPRETIAGYPGNDMGYVTHGALQVALALQALNVLPLQALQSSILDFGCGTARIARILTRHFRRVAAYDPSPECIQEAQREAQACLPLRFCNLSVSSDWTAIAPQAPFDYVCSISVFEHLVPAAAHEAFDLVDQVLQPGGRAVLWLHQRRNSDLIERIKPHLHTLTSPIGIYVWTKG